MKGPALKRASLFSAMLMLAMAPTVIGAESSSPAGGDKTGQTPAPAAAPVRLLKTAAPVTVDGVLDEPCWKAAAPVRVEYAYGKQGVKAQSLPAVVYYTWDQEYLYVGYETFDTNLRAAGNGEKKGPRGHRREGCRIGGRHDVFEVFVSFNDPNFFWELHHNALNNFTDIWVTVAPPDSPLASSTMTTQGIHWAKREYLNEGKKDHAKTETAVRLKTKKDGKPSTVNNGDDVDSGYVGEMRLPWKSLGAPRTWLAREESDMHGQTIVLFSAVDNPDLEPRYHHTAPDLEITGFFHLTAANWPRYLLIDAKKEPAAANVHKEDYIPLTRRSQGSP